MSVAPQSQAEVEPVGRPDPGRRWRWIVAVLASALVVAASVGVLAVASGASGPSTVARWAPAATIGYVEARFDLPGDQRDGLGALLTAFPGFADRSTLDPKLAEVYDRIVRAASNGRHDYSTEIAPWFGGQLAIAVQDGWQSAGAAVAASLPHAVLIATVTDASKARTWLTGALPAGPVTSSTTYRGVVLTIAGPPARPIAAGFDGPVLLIGDTGAVEAAIDTTGTTGLAATTSYMAAMAALPNDHLAFAFGRTGDQVSATASPGPCGLSAVGAPGWAAIAATAGAGRLILEAAAPSPNALGSAPNGSPSPTTAAPTNRPGTLAARLPAATLVVVDVHDVGALVDRAVGIVSRDPTCGAAVGSLGGILDRLGGLASVTSWIGDTDVVVTNDGSGVTGGLVISLADQTSAAAAAGWLATIRNVVALARGASAVTETVVQGTTITTVDLGPIGSLSSLVAPPGSQPSAPVSPPGAGGSSSIGGEPVRISYAIENGLAVVGLGGPAFVASVVTVPPGGSLADSSRYAAAIGAAGRSNVASAYVDLASLISTVAASLPPDRATTFTTDVAPYVTPLDAAAASIQVGDLIRIRLVMTVH